MLNSVLLASVVFHIAAGTGSGNWNTPEDPIVITRGDTLEIHNDDDITHQVHTFGKPCRHGGPIYPGEMSDSCVIYPDSEPGSYKMLDHRTFAVFYLEILP